MRWLPFREGASHKLAPRRGGSRSSGWPRVFFTPICIDFMLSTDRLAAIAEIQSAVPCPGGGKGAADGDPTTAAGRAADPYFGALGPSSSGFMEEFGFVPATGGGGAGGMAAMGSCILGGEDEYDRLLVDDLFAQGPLVIHENEYLDFGISAGSTGLSSSKKSSGTGRGGAMTPLRDITNDLGEGGAALPPSQSAGHRKKRAKLQTAGREGEIVIVQHHFDAQERTQVRTTLDADLSRGGVESRKKRHPEDMYTPRWVRGSGGSREGYCELCHPGVWLKIKQSAYWYHMNFIHGISAATGKPYDPPRDFRESAVLGPAGRTVLQVEGRCDACLTWVILGQHELGSIPEETHYVNASWWRHQQKCLSTALRHVQGGGKRPRYDTERL